MLRKEVHTMRAARRASLAAARDAARLLGREAHRAHELERSIERAIAARARRPTAPAR